MKRFIIQNIICIGRIVVRAVAYIWGVGGVLLVLGFAIYRLAPMAYALSDFTLSPLHWFSLVLTVAYMAYAEGYKGFHLAFAPRVVARADYLAQHPRLHHLLLAPLFCMCYIHTTRRRQLISIGLTCMILGFVLIARQLPQPWRGIVDAGVVVGLGLGIISILYFMVSARGELEQSFALAEVPIEA
jgi:hypothetical protein